MPTSLIGTAPNQVPRNADLGSLAYQNRENVTVQNLLIAQKDTPIYAGYQPAAMGLTVITAGDNSSIYDQGRNGPAPAILLANAGWTDVGTYTETNIDFAYIDNNSVLGTNPQARIGVTGAYNPYINSSPYNEAEGWFRIATRGSNPEGRMTDRLLITKDGYSIFNGNVAIGTLGERTGGSAPYTTPTTKLYVISDSAVGGGTTNPVSGTATLAYDGGYAANSYGAALTFSQKYYSSSTAQIAVGQIAGVKTDGDGTFGGGLAFLTTPTGSNTFTERMRIDSAGVVRIGATTNTGSVYIKRPYYYSAYNAGLAIAGDTADPTAYFGNVAGSYISSGAYYYGSGYVQLDSSSSAFSALHMPNTGNFVFYSNTGSAGAAISQVERMRINTTGTVILQGGNTSASGVGISFPAAQSASSDANTLDDYEEGTWTPVPQGDSGAATNITAGGTYVKIGKMVHLTCYCGFSKGTLSGGVRIGGLPFTIATNGNYPQAPLLMDQLTGLNYNPLIQFNQTQTYVIAIINNFSTGDHSQMNWSIRSANIGALRFTATYMTD